MFILGDFSSPVEKGEDALDSSDDEVEIVEGDTPRIEN